MCATAVLAMRRLLLFAVCLMPAKQTLVVPVLMRQLSAPMVFLEHMSSLTIEDRLE